MCKGYVPPFLPTCPSIFTAHTLIDHAELKPDTEVEQGYVRELVLHASDLPQFTSYNALGHIHLGQEVRGTGKPTWYSGAPDRLDMGERDYHPQVLLVTTPDAPGGTATVRAITMPNCTTWMLTDLSDEESVDRFCLEVAGHNPIGRVTINGIFEVDADLLNTEGFDELLFYWIVGKYRATAGIAGLVNTVLQRVDGLDDLAKVDSKCATGGWCAEADVFAAGGGAVSTD